jgi:hypothetical protein
VFALKEMVGLGELEFILLSPDAMFVLFSDDFGAVATG